MPNCIAAVSCSVNTPRLRWGRIWVLIDGQAAPCMASVHGWCVGGAWVYKLCGILPGWWGFWIGEVEPEHWDLVLEGGNGGVINQNPNPAPAQPRGIHTT